MASAAAPSPAAVDIKVYTYNSDGTRNERTLSLLPSQTVSEAVAEAQQTLNLEGTFSLNRGKVRFSAKSTLQEAGVKAGDCLRLDRRFSAEEAAAHKEKLANLSDKKRLLADAISLGTEQVLDHLDEQDSAAQKSDEKLDALVELAKGNVGPLLGSDASTKEKLAVERLAVYNGQAKVRVLREELADERLYIKQQKQEKHQVQALLAADAQELVVGDLNTKEDVERAKQANRAQFAALRKREKEIEAGGAQASVAVAAAAKGKSPRLELSLKPS